MSITPQFQKLVDLYRLLQRPPIEHTKFCAQVNYNDEHGRLLSGLWGENCCNLTITVNGTDYSTDMEEEIPDLMVGQSIGIEVSAPRTERCFFYADTNDWLNSASPLPKGNLPNNTYLCKEDTVVADDENLPEIVLVRTVCSLIRLLGEIAHYRDGSPDSNESYRLVYVIPDKDNKIYHPVTLQTQFTSDLLKYAAPDISVLESILNERNQARSIHASERVSIFQIALAEFIEHIPNNEPAFLYLIEHWNDVIESFNKSWDRYLSGFTFDKLKAELADQQAAASQKLSDIVSSLSGRLFSLPIAISGIGILEKADSDVANWFYLLSNLLVSYMVYSAVGIQKDNLANAQSSYQMSLSKFKRDKGIDQRDNEIIQILQNVIKTLDATFSRLSCRLKFFAWIAWLPLIASLTYMLIKANDSFWLDLIK